MPDYYTDLQYKGETFRVWIRDCVERAAKQLEEAHKEESDRERIEEAMKHSLVYLCRMKTDVVTIPSRWHLDIERVKTTVERRNGFPAPLAWSSFTPASDRDLAAQELEADFIWWSDWNPHHNSLSSAKRHIKKLLRNVTRSRLNKKRWGLVVWDGKWHRSA